MQFSYKQCKAFPQVAEFLNSTEEILLMLKWCFPCQSKTYEPYSEQLVNLGCVLFCLLEISYFRAQQIMSYTKEVRSFTILFVGLFKFTLMFDKVQLCATRLVFLLKVRSKLDSVFSLYQSQTQSTMPDLVKNGDLFFSTFYLSSQKSVCYSMKRACQREKAPSFKPLQLNFTIEVRAYCIFLTLHLCHLIKSFDISWKRNWKHSSWSLFFKFYWVKCLLH